MSALCFQAASQIVATILQLSKARSPALTPKTNPVSYNEVKSFFFAIYICFCSMYF